MVRHAPIHRRSGHSDIAICCGRNVLGSSPSTYGGAPLESGHHFESQTIQRIQNVFGRTLRFAFPYWSTPAIKVICHWIIETMVEAAIRRWCCHVGGHSFPARWPVPLG